MQRTPKSRPPIRLQALWLFVFTAVQACLQLPGIGRPWGVHENNPGCYFVPFGQNLQEHGFFELRGALIGPSLLENLEFGSLYLNHPPLLAWMAYAVDGSELAFRAISIGFLILCCQGMAWLIWRQLEDRATAPRPRHEASLAPLLGGLVLGLVPMTAVLCIGSYEVQILAFGLWATVAMDSWRRTREANPDANAGVPRGPFWTLIVCSVGGTLTDWLFAFPCLGLCAVAWGKSIWPGVRRLAVPAIASGVSAIGVIAWREFVLAAPNLPKVETASDGLGSLTEFMFYFPDPDLWWESVGRNLERGFGWPLLVVGGVGLLTCLRTPRYLLAFLPTLLVPVMFSTHAIHHHHFYAPLLPLFALGFATGLFRIAPPLSRRPVAAFALGCALLIPATWETVRVKSVSTTEFCREFGEALSAAATDPAPEGSDEPELYLVGHSWVYFGAYVTTERVLVQPTRDLAVIYGANTTVERPTGIRYLWLDVEAIEPGAIRPPFSQDSPGLDVYLGQLPYERIDELIGEVHWSVYEPPVRIRDARLYTIRPYGD